MGTRRTRSCNGDDSSGSSRPGGCSYLSNVRPENRSTLCNVIAQLVEETQPFFETTLKSKAVSERCNVKFSCVVTGYPIPQVTWYKDDMQLDRYCGLPKYEIFRNGRNHSLHIYNCTEEDAAIYQASASNSKGIVSCSGLLEVGEMNEFKIHQRYFAKLKQNAEKRRKELEGKENLELLRTISPDRSQRKRRSTMEAFCSTPSSMEGDNSQTVAKEAEVRRQETTTKDVEETPTPITNGEMSTISNRQDFKEKVKRYDSAQISTAHQPKSPFVKKKIKISNSAKVVKADNLRDNMLEENQATEKTSTPAAQYKGDSEDVMEVQNILHSSILCSESSGKYKESASEKDVPTNDERFFVKGSVPSEKDPPIAPVHPPAVSATTQNKRKQTVMHKKEAGCKDSAKSLEMQKQSHHTNSTQMQSSTAATRQQPVKEDIGEADGSGGNSLRLQIVPLKRASETVSEDFPLRAQMSSKSNGGTLAHRDLDSLQTRCETKTALHQHVCEQTADQLSEEETRRRQNTASVSWPLRLGEVAHAHKMMNRNDAPVSPERQRDPCSVDAQLPQKTSSETEEATDDILNPSQHSDLQAGIARIAETTWDHSRGSSESNALFLPELQESPLESPADGGNTLLCNVLPTAQQSQADTAVKTDEGTEVDEKVKVNEVDRLLVQAGSDGLNEKTAEIEMENDGPQTIEETNVDKTMDTQDTTSIDHAPNIGEEFHSELENRKTAPFGSLLPNLIKHTENKNTHSTNVSAQQTKCFNGIPKSTEKVVSIAVLLRSQIKALEATVPVPGDYGQQLLTDTCQEVGASDNKSKADVTFKTKPDETSPTSIKATLMEVYQKLNENDQKKVQSCPVKALQKPLVLPSTSDVDKGSITDNTGLLGSAKKYNKGATDTDQETEASTLVLLKEIPVGSLSDKQNAEITVAPLTSCEELTDTVTESSTLPVPISQELVTAIEKDYMLSSDARSSSQKSLGAILDDVQSKAEIPEIKLVGENHGKIDEIDSTAPLCQEHNKSALGAEEEGIGLLRIQEDTSVTDGLSGAESSPLLKKRNCILPIPSATPQELASGARRKMLIPKSKTEETTEASLAANNPTRKMEDFAETGKLSSDPVTLSTSPGLSRRATLQPATEKTSPGERRSPMLSRRKMIPDLTEDIQTSKTEEQPAEKNKHDPFKAPQVIRKIRSETFSDAAGHLKLWCQFFNVLSDSTVKWYRNDVEITHIKRKAGDETQVNLAIVQASCQDCGVYRCTIINEHGTDSTDCLLSVDILAGMSLREDFGAGEEIEMTPLVFNKGVADSGVWGNKFFGRIMIQESHVGDGCSHKVWRAKVIYGLEPVFESGCASIIKVRNPIPYGGKGESCLIERSLDSAKQECVNQNLAREYCKIFSAETRVIENFGQSLEVIPVYLMYRPANTIPYATVEAELKGDYQKYSGLDHTGRLLMKTGSEVEQKCCTLQHWMFEWTNGNLLLTQLEGVDTRITNVGFAVKSTGHQGLCIEGNPKVFEQFLSQHQCNYYCGLLGLRSLKVMESLMTPTKHKGSRSPLLQRKAAVGSSSPQTNRKAAVSPRLPRKVTQDSSNTETKQKAPDAPQVHLE